MKQVLAYDDEPELRKQLSAVFFSLKTEYYLASVFPNAADVLQHIESYHPDIILMDINMRENSEDGLIALYQIKQKRPDQKVLMLTTFDDDDNIFKAICLGADGYMLKSDFIHYLPHEVMRRSLHIIFSDGAYLTPAVAKKMMFLFRDAGVTDKAIKLIGRFKNLIAPDPRRLSLNPEYALKEIHLAILTDIVAGKKSSQIADERSMPENTVNHHIKAIYRELEVHSRAQAVRKAIEKSIISLIKG